MSERERERKIERTYVDSNFNYNLEEDGDYYDYECDLCSRILNGRRSKKRVDVFVYLWIKTRLGKNVVSRAEPHAYERAMYILLHLDVPGSRSIRYTHINQRI